MIDALRLASRMVCVGFEGTNVSPELRQMIQHGVRSVILFTRNFESPAQLAELCWEIKSIPADGQPVLICIDQEGGRVQRLGEPFTRIPSMRQVGESRDPHAARRIGRIMARELRAVNIDMNLAPVLDVDSNPANPVIGERSFSCDPSVVASMGCSLIDGLQSAGIAACAKHFPGHGDTSTDSHLHLPRLPHDLDRLRRVELPPFQAAVRENVAAVMCAHVLFDAIDPQRPATMSEKVIHNLLRRELEFAGAVFSDDLEMKAIVDHFGVEQAVLRGAEAGIDLFFVCKSHELQQRAIDALARAIGDNVLLHRHIKAAHARLDDLFNRFVRPPSKWTRKSIELLGPAMQ